MFRSDVTTYVYQEQHYMFWQHYDPALDSASNRNKSYWYFMAGKGGQFLGMKTMAPSCVKSGEVWGLQPKALSRPV
jgi:hypothetical protein